MAYKPQGAKKSPRESPKKANRKAGNESKNTTIISFKESDILQRWLVTTEGCPTCAEAKRDFKKEFKSGKIKPIDVGEDKGFEIITELGLTEVPVFVVELKPGHPSGVKFIVDE
jgi:hypothetical protein